MMLGSCKLLCSESSRTNAYKDHLTVERVIVIREQSILSNLDCVISVRDVWELIVLC